VLQADKVNAHSSEAAARVAKEMFVMRSSKTKTG
jgi:hypothetical protein